jgi:hypothetical protein
LTVWLESQKFSEDRLDPGIGLAQSTAVVGKGLHKRCSLLVARPNNILLEPVAESFLFSKGIGKRLDFGILVLGSLSARLWNCVEGDT